MGRQADKDFLQGTGGASIGFSRLLSLATRMDVASLLEIKDGPSDCNEGIEDTFLDKLEYLWYFRENIWAKIGPLGND